MEEKKRDGYSFLKETWRRLKKKKAAVVSLFIILILVLVAIFAPLIAPYPYDEQDTSHVLAGSSREHLLGTDRIGRDMLSRLIYGTRNSLMISAISMRLFTSDNAGGNTRSEPAERDHCHRHRANARNRETDESLHPSGPRDGIC